MSDRAYSDEEVKEILQRAVEQEAARDAGALTHEELVSAAGEIGISADDVERAAVELLLTRAHAGEADDLTTYKRGRHLSLLRGALIFLAAIAATAGAQALSGVGEWIFLPLMVPAFFLTAYAIFVFLQDPEKAKRAARRSADKRHRRDRLRDRKRAKPVRRQAPRPHMPPHTSKNANVSQLVDEGVGLLLKVIAASHEKSGPRKQGEFGRYVKRRAGGPARARVDASEVADEQPEEVTDESARRRTRER